MRARYIVGIILVVLVAATGAIFLLRPEHAPQVARGATARNVILISIDTLRADHLSSYGYHRATSPKLDAFAKRGARFEKAISSSGWTVPAHMSMLTGLDALTHGVGGYPNPGKRQPKGETLAQILTRNDFATGAFVGGGYLWPQSGFKLGFNKYSSKGREFSANIDDARQWVRDHQNERFFLFFHGYDVHRPYTPSAKNRDLFSNNYSGNFSMDDFEPDKPRPSPVDLEFVISQYDAEIRDVDDLLSGLLAEWEEMGLLENTLVVITADHGDEFYEHGQIYHAHSLYDELLHVPLIIVGPGVAPGVHATQVGLIDVTPTILSALGLGTEGKNLQGIDLTPVMRGETEPPDRMLVSYLSFNAFPYSIAALRSDDWKFIFWDVAGMRGKSLGKKPAEYTYKFRRDHQENFDEFFDLRSDPGETKNIGGEQAATREQFASLLNGRLATRERPAPGSKKKPKLSPKEREDLKALGYL